MLPGAKATALLLVGLLAFAGGTVRAGDRGSSPVSQAELDRALARNAAAKDADRDAIRRLLQRQDVRALASGYGLDARRAEAAVGTLDGEELRRLASHAATVETQLAGGDELVVRMSLVAMLLIVIIVILLAQS